MAPEELPRKRVHRAQRKKKKKGLPESTRQEIGEGGESPENSRARPTWNAKETWSKCYASRDHRWPTKIAKNLKRFHKVEKPYGTTDRKGKKTEKVNR